MQHCCTRDKNTDYLKRFLNDWNFIDGKLKFEKNNQSTKNHTNTAIDPDINNNKTFMLYTPIVIIYKINSKIV